MSFDIKEYFTEIANAIRNKKGTTKKISAKNFASEIESINTSSVPEGYLKPEGKIYISDTNETDVSKYATAQVFDSNLKAENIKKGAYILGITGTYDNSIKGITQGTGQYGSNDINIDGNTITTTGITIDSYSGGLAVSNSTEDNERINLKVQGNVDIQIEDASINNIITANNLLPENIKAGVEILGTVGTLSGTGSSFQVKRLDFTKDYNTITNTTDQTEITTYAYQLTEEERLLLNEYVVNNKTINGCSGTIGVVIDYSGTTLVLSSSLNGYWDIIYQDNKTSFNSVDYPLSFSNACCFDIDDNGIIYLSQLEQFSYNNGSLTSQGNLISQFLPIVKEVYISIPIE